MDKFFYPGKGAVLFMLCEIYIESLGCYVFYLRGVVWLFKEKVLVKIKFIQLECLCEIKLHMFTKYPLHILQGKNGSQS